MSADTQRGVERIVAFSDGVVAIAITLLVLPLTDIEARGRNVWSVLLANHSALFGFALSFAVIASYWATHHVLLQSLHGHTSTLIRINTAWLATIAFLPFPTSLIEDDIHGGVTTLYIATLLAASAMTLVLARYLVRHPELRQRQSTTDLRAEVASGWAAIAALAVAVALSLLSARLGLVALLLLVPAQRIATASSARRTRRRYRQAPPGTAGVTPASAVTRDLVSPP